MWIGGGHLVMAGNFHLVTAAGTSIPGPSTDTLAPTLQVGSATTASFFFIKKRLLLVNFTVRFQPMCGQSILLSEDATCGHGRVIHQTEVYRESIRHFSKHVEDRQWVHDIFVWVEGAEHPPTLPGREGLFGTCDRRVLCDACRCAELKCSFVSFITDRWAVRWLVYF